jgi:glycosyltransferase involved in cell wall biosynthesis
MISKVAIKISIISINFNNKEGLLKTMESVFNQTFQDYEYIVIDGGSTDGGKELIESNQHKINYWISEPDNGIYNAMNKGIKEAKGEYLFFLNSGDTFYNIDVLDDISNKITDNLDVFYGNVNVVDNKGKQELRFFPENLTFNFFLKQTITHQAAIIRKSLFDEVFLYNENFKLVSDWEFFICAICKLNKTYKKLNLTIVNYGLDGVSSDSIHKNLLLKERKKSLEKHFPLFLKDYNRLHKQTKLLKLNRFKILIELENSKIAQVFNSIILKFQLKLFRNKRIKDLN